ncbi:hypothetical protein [Leptolyngbya sp. CCY15150]|uniref:hypothetical protein n=1 Tax=Leptolyngbya sp. CCY15150 TaxID=2767772 RepID=UPI00194EA42F|nr:hypothetical protein [Leptolyngbya sp. CCY15150]
MEHFGRSDHRGQGASFQPVVILHPPMHPRPILTFGAIAALMPLWVSSGAIAQARPNPVVYSSGVTLFEDITLTPNFTPNPATVRGLSGGNQAASDMVQSTQSSTGLCNGFINDQPDHTMVLTQPFPYLSLQVQSRQDTTLIVRDQDGNTWCNDNYQTFSPAIIGEWAAGTYRIWVGGISPRQSAPYVITLSETPETAANPVSPSTIPQLQR